MAIKMLKDGRWICYYRHKGFDGVSRLKKEYFGRGAAGQAAAKKRNEALKLKKRRPAAAEPHGPTVAELSHIYLTNKNFSAKSANAIKTRLTASILPFFGHRAARDLVDQNLDTYIKKRRLDPIYNPTGKIIRYGVIDATIARELTDLQSILNWSKKRRPPLIAFNPVADYVKPKGNLAIIAPPTAAEIQKIINNASDHLKRALIISYYTGLRPGAVELLTLRWTDVDFEGRTILVRSAHKGGPERRSVPIHDGFLADLRAWHSKDNKRGPIIRYGGRAIKSIAKAWAGTLKRAGINRRLRPYDFRHAFITLALEDGADLKALSQVVGSSPETIMRHYQHVSKQLHRDTVARIPALVD